MAQKQVPRKAKLKPGDPGYVYQFPHVALSGFMARGETPPPELVRQAEGPLTIEEQALNAGYDIP